VNIQPDLIIETPPDEPIIRFRRPVAAAPERVFAAWTEPDQLRRWWGPAEWTLVVCEVDLRIGGGYRFVHQDRDGNRFGTRGTYLQIETGRLLVNTFSFDGTPDRQCVDTVEFRPTSTGTLVCGTSVHASIADRDAHIAGGMERGMRDTYRRLDAHLKGATMATVTADLFVSLDGWARGEHSPGYFGYFGPDLEQWIGTELAQPQHVLMGRRTYAALAGLPDEHRDEGYRQMSELPTTVFSRTLTDAEWPHATVESRDAVEAVRALKDTSDVSLRTMGSLSIVKQLLNAGVLDRLRLMVFPLLVGPGGRESTFDGVAETDLELISQRVLDDRILLAEYAPTGQPIPH
jgi:uncharacterized protein YndB with AHSA1/START domain/dihydrofolate reductase